MKYPQAERARLLIDDLARDEHSVIQKLRKPAAGWLKTVREALNMPQREFARRLAVSQPAVQALEARERTGTITMEALERAADALGCDLVYALIPRRPLQDTLEEQAAHVAKKQWAAVAHSMALEDQQVTQEPPDLEELTRTTLSAGTAIWPPDA